MPAGPRKQPPPKPLPADLAVPQDVFSNAGRDLAAQLGWYGEPDWEQHDIRVADAITYCIKVLHEAHQAAARRHPLPDADKHCQHLHVDTPGEMQVFREAVAAAYATGKDKVFIEARGMVREIVADLHGSAAQALGALGKMGEGK